MLTQFPGVTGYTKVHIPTYWIGARGSVSFLDRHRSKISHSWSQCDYFLALSADRPRSPPRPGNQPWPWP
jgi:hypothetical protein